MIGQENSRHDAPQQGLDERALALRQALMRRARLQWWRAPAEARPPRARLMLAEFAHAASWRARHGLRSLAVPLAKHPRVVLLVPGFATNPGRMRAMALALERAGHTVKSWKLGYNLGPSVELLARLDQRLCEISERHGEQVVLVGWSLGGVFAREIAKHHPEAVAKVITLGSPFSHSPYSNRAWRTYQMITGLPPDKPPITANLREKPPMETVALWSPRDALVSPRAARGRPGERDRAVALRCTHLGFVDSPEAIMAVLDELSPPGLAPPAAIRA